MKPTISDEIVERVGRKYSSAETQLQRIIADAASRGGSGVSYYRAQYASAVVVIGDLLEDVLPLVTKGAILSYVIGELLADTGQIPDIGLDYEAHFSPEEQSKVDELVKQTRDRMVQLHADLGMQVKKILTRVMEQGISQEKRSDTASKAVDRVMERLRDLQDRGLATFVDGQVRGKNMRLLAKTGKDGKTRHYQLEPYIRSVTSYTFREIHSQGTVDRLIANGSPYVRISQRSSDVPDVSDVCDEFAGRTFALVPEAALPGIPFLPPEDLPPYHLNCTHWAFPAVVAKRSALESVALV